MKSIRVTRRQALRLGLGAATAACLPLTGLQAQDADDLILRSIPSSGEQLPVIGVGTNAYSVTEAADVAERLVVLRHLAQRPNSMVDTAQVYGDAEVVIGRMLTSAGNRDQLFIASKTPIDSDFRDPDDLVNLSLRRMQLSQMDLMMVHNLGGTEVMLPALQRAKDAGQVRYIGMSTSVKAHYPETMRRMREGGLDFIQIDYSIDNRSAADDVLPLAQELGIAVIINTPFGGRRNADSLFARASRSRLPDFARAIDVDSFAQLFLKYLASHPAVTTVIPGMTRIDHLLDNLGAGVGRLPDADMRREIEQWWDAIA